MKPDSDYRGFTCAKTGLRFPAFSPGWESPYQGDWKTVASDQSVSRADVASRLPPNLFDDTASQSSCIDPRPLASDPGTSSSVGGDTTKSCTTHDPGKIKNLPNCEGYLDKYHKILEQQGTSKCRDSTKGTDRQARHGHSAPSSPTPQILRGRKTSSAVFDANWKNPEEAGSTRERSHRPTSASIASENGESDLDDQEDRGIARRSEMDPSKAEAQTSHRTMQGSARRSHYLGDSSDGEESEAYSTESVTHEEMVAKIAQQLQTEEWLSDQHPSDDEEGGVKL